MAKLIAAKDSKISNGSLEAGVVYRLAPALKMWEDLSKNKRLALKLGAYSSNVKSDDLKGVEDLLKVQTTDAFDALQMPIACLDIESMVIGKGYYDQVDLTDALAEYPEDEDLRDKAVPLGKVSAKELGCPLAKWVADFAGKARSEFYKELQKAPKFGAFCESRRSYAFKTKDRRVYWTTIRLWALGDSAQDAEKALKDLQAKGL